ncbi:MAG TPA: hypothetical protein PKU79_09085, partial [Mesotoga sp.]|nr:hypothetical protein [Mesotoga sp.]
THFHKIFASAFGTITPFEKRIFRSDRQPLHIFAGQKTLKTSITRIDHMEISTFKTQETLMNEQSITDMLEG